jgi:hypothetical protein
MKTNVSGARSTLLTLALVALALFLCASTPAGADSSDFGLCGTFPGPALSIQPPAVPLTLYPKSAPNPVMGVALQLVYTEADISTPTSSCSLTLAPPTIDFGGTCDPYVQLSPIYQIGNWHLVGVYVANPCGCGGSITFDLVYQAMQKNSGGGVTAVGPTNIREVKFAVPPACAMSS